MLCNKQVRTTLTVLFIQFNSADAHLQLGHATAERSKFIIEYKRIVAVLVKEPNFKAR